MDLGPWAIFAEQIPTRVTIRPGGTIPINETVPKKKNVPTAELFQPYVPGSLFCAGKKVAEPNFDEANNNTSAKSQAIETGKESVLNVSPESPRLKFQWSETEFKEQYCNYDDSEQWKSEQYSQQIEKEVPRPKIPNMGLFDLKRAQNMEPVRKQNTLLRPPKNPSFNKHFPSPPKASEPPYNFVTLVQEHMRANGRILPLYQYYPELNDEDTIIRTQEPGEHWVTVYGFEPPDAQMILEVFQQCGNILEKKFAPQNGNWVHLRYATLGECDRAKSYHKKVLYNRLMLAVEHHEREKNLNDEITPSNDLRRVIQSFVPPHATEFQIASGEGTCWWKKMMNCFKKP